MAGYSWDDGKSWNAVAAEADGRFPASFWVKWLRRWPRYRGLTAADIRDIVPSSEWHHSSKYFNRVDYFEAGDIFDARKELRARIALRKEWKAVVREAKKAGLTHIHFRAEDGELKIWYPIGLAKMTSLNVSRIRQELENGYAQS